MDSLSLQTEQNLKKLEASRRGMAVVAVMTVLFFVLAISLIGVVSIRAGGANEGGRAGVGSTSGHVLQTAKTRINAYQAQNLGETGVEMALQWLASQPTPPANTVAFAPSGFFGASTTNNYAVLNFGSGTIQVRLYPYADNLSTGKQKSYLIESIGTYQGKRQILRAVALQDTFAKYAVFTDEASDSWWVGGLTKFNGPVHINNSNNKTINMLWKSGGNTNNRIFTYNGQDAFSTSANSINWNKNSVGAKTNPTSSTDWKGIAAGGSGSVRTGVAPVTMPSSSSVQENAALGTTTSKPLANAAPQVILPNAGGTMNGGLYIHGDVEDMVFSTSGTGNVIQTVTVNQTDTAAGKKYEWKIVIDPITNTTKMDKKATPIAGGASTTTTTTYSGTPNGVIYSDGNIGEQGNPKTGGVSGTIADNYVSGTNVLHANNINLVTANNKDLNFDGSLTYKTSGDATKTGIMGVVSRRIQIIDKDSSGNSIKNININATVMAYDTFDVTNPLTRPTGSFNLTGGYIAKSPGNFGSFDGNSGALVSGFTRVLNYDVRVASTPPSYFPSTSNQYFVTSWQREGTTLQ